MIKHLAPYPKTKLIKIALKESQLRKPILISFVTLLFQVILRFIASDWSFPGNFHVIFWSVVSFGLCICWILNFRKIIKNNE